tara:strand:+ start:1923 stop:3620 length:1698 start_codon:yes stop_codon:yes gene_type:complete
MRLLSFLTTRSRQNSRAIAHNIYGSFNRDTGYTKEIKTIMKNTFNNPPNIPSIIDGKRIYSDTKTLDTKTLDTKTLDTKTLDTKVLNSQIQVKYKQMSPLEHRKTVCTYNSSDKEFLDKYLSEYNYYKQSLECLSTKDIATIFRKAAILLTSKYKEEMLAYTIMGQGKSVYEADLDAICELADFLNFNAEYAHHIVDKQPYSPYGVVNESKYNPLNGFVAAITPFNFTAIGGNLASAPTLFKNSVIWKPSDNAILSNYLFYEIMIEAGLPKEAITFAPCNPKLFTNTIVKSPELGGLLFTGSNHVFRDLSKTIYSNISSYNNYPRIIGETGGKNFHFVHTHISKMDMNFIAKKTVESAYGYSGQKCSACSILYLPRQFYDSFLESFKQELVAFMNEEAFQNYGIINSRAYSRIRDTMYTLRDTNKHKLLVGGNLDHSKNFYVEPTLFMTDNHDDDIFKKEFFAPILTMYLYDEDDLLDTMKLCKNTTKYALTGSVFSNDQQFIDFSTEFFKEKCGNFYINDKSTGSVVGQQPFGGSGHSGTNDKAGDINMLYRLFNQQNIKTNIV